MLLLLYSYILSIAYCVLKHINKSKGLVPCLNLSFDHFNILMINTWLHSIHGPLHREYIFLIFLSWNMRTKGSYTLETFSSLFSPMKILLKLNLSFSNYLWHWDPILHILHHPESAQSGRVNDIKVVQPDNN